MGEFLNRKDINTSSSTRWRLEFHCHTHYSKDGLTSPQKLVAVCRRKGIDRVVVTDHNSIAGAVAAQQLDPDRVIIGEEIMTQKGELLAAYVKEEIPAGLSPIETIKILRAQGAFISVSHPFDQYRGGHWALNELLKIAPLVDAIEIFNARCFPRRFNQQAKDFAHEKGLAGTVGSDAHAPFELGRAVQIVPPFFDAQSLKRAIQSAGYETRVSPLWVRLVSRYAVLRKRFI